MGDIDKLKKQLRDLTDLYESEKERANNAQQTLGDFWRREPLVHLMWSEITLLRKLLETHYKQAPAILDLPQQRASERSKGNPLTFRDRLVATALKVFNEKNTSVDDFLSGNFSTGMTQSPTKILQQQTEQRQQPLGASNDIVSEQIQQQQNRIIQLEHQLQQYHGEIQRLNQANGTQMDSNNNIPPPVDGIPPPPMDGGVPPPPTDGVSSNASTGAASNIPAPPVLPGFVGKAGGAAPAGGSSAPGPSTVPGTSIPMPPVLPGFAAKYPGQGAGQSQASGAGPAAAAAPPVDPGPQPTKPSIKPTKKMKALHWKPIITGDKAKQSQAAKDSIWNQIDRVYAIATRDVSVADFEDKFTSAPPKSKIGKDEPDAQAKALAESNKPQRLLDPNRHNQLSIMLSKMPPLPDMKKALIALDGEKLKSQHIESLHKNMFTAEDVELVKSSGLPKEKLMLPEQWILEMSSIPQLAARIECWRFSQVFQDDYISVIRPLARLESTCNEIRTSGALRQWFTYILVVGNHLNGSTARGRADGFDLDSLSKLFRIKDSDGTGTLIDYLVSFMVNKFGPDITSQLRSELSVLPESKISSLRQIAGDAKKLLGKINLTLKMQSLVIAQNIPGDQFERVLGSFASDAEHKVKSLDARATTALQAFFEAVQYLEPHLEKGQVEKTQSEEWLPLLDEFVQGVVKSHQEKIRRVEQAEKEAKQAANMAVLKAKAGANPNSQASAGVAPELTEGGFPKLRSVQRQDGAGSPDSHASPNPANELAGGFPKLRSAQDPNPAQRPVDQNPGFVKPQLRSAGQPNQQQQPQQQPEGFVKPQLRSAGQPNQQQQPQQQPEGYVKPQLKKTETKTAQTQQQTQVQNVPASEFDNVKRPTAKSNVFLKAQSKPPMGQVVKQQEQKMQLLPPPQEDLPPPPMGHFGDDDDESGSEDDIFFRGLDLPPPPPDSDTD